MFDYSDAFSAYPPSRVTMLENGQGRLCPYTLNMDLMIYGGGPLAEKLKAETVKLS